MLTKVVSFGIKTNNNGLKPLSHTFTKRCFNHANHCSSSGFEPYLHRWLKVVKGIRLCKDSKRFKDIYLNILKIEFVIFIRVLSSDSSQIVQHYCSRLMNAKSLLHLWLEMLKV